MAFPTLKKLVISLLICASSQCVSAMDKEKEEGSTSAAPDSLLERDLNLSPIVQQFFIEVPEKQLKDKMSWFPYSYQFQSAELKELFKQYEPIPMNMVNIVILNALYDKFRNSFYTLLKLAKAGHAEAQYHFATGLRFQNDSHSQSLAKELLHKAAAQGHRDSIYELSDAYKRGADYYLIAQDPHIAHLLCQEAAALGHKKAQLEVASTSLDSTSGFPRNYSLAEDYNRLLAASSAVSLDESASTHPGNAESEAEMGEYLIPTEEEVRAASRRADKILRMGPAYKKRRDYREK